ncbi:MAG: EamA-like transporter family protein, partial [Hyphomicrobiales bacterium]
MTDLPATRLNPLHLVAAFGTGCLLTLMVHFNGELGRYGNGLFASWAAHGTGTVAALVFLGLLWVRRRPATDVAPKPPAPWWAYLGGASGAVTVILTSITVNSPLALSGTLALGLAGQVVFGLAADRWGFLGMPRRKPELRDYG